MKTLLLVRHAKSSWDDWSLADHDRPLAPRGRNAAPLVADHMADEGLIPAVVLCSTAVRTRQTWDLMSPTLGETAEVDYLPSLYGAGPGTMMEAVMAHADDRSPVLLVAHNPGTEDLARALCGSGPDDSLARMQTKYPTAALAVIDFDVPSWSDVTAGSGVLRSFVRPKDL